MSSPIRITFDSNVWRIIATPDKFPKEPSLDSLKIIRDIIENHKIIPCLSETTFTLETIKNSDRKVFFGSYKPVIKITGGVTDDGMISLSFEIGPDHTKHPGNNPIIDKHFQDALALGFKLLSCPRIAGITNPDLDKKNYLNEESEALCKRLDDLGRIMTDIENRQCGFAHIRAIGDRYKSANKNWTDGLMKAPDNENRNIEKAIAEWADGDAVATHIAYENDYFCTRDIAKSGGVNSILSDTNRQWTEQNFGTKFITPENLATLLKTK